MLLRYFSGNKNNGLILIFLLAVVLWLPAFLSSELVPVSAVEPMVLYSFIADIVNRNVLLSKILGLIFLLFQSYLLVLLSGKFILLKGRSNLPALFFVMIGSFYPGLQQFSEALVASLFMIISINFFFEAYDKDSFSYRFFDAGLILGLGSLFYAKLILFLPILWIAAIILRKVNWREYIMPVFGMAIPLFMLAGIDFLRGEDPWHIFMVIDANLHHTVVDLHTDAGFWIIVGILFLSVVISSVYMLKIFQFGKIFIRNYYLVFFWIFVTGLINFVLFSSFDMGISYIIALPVSFLMSNYFFNTRKTRANKLLFSLIVLVFVLNGVNLVFGWV